MAARARPAAGALCLCLVLCCGVAGESEEPIPDKVGTDVHLSKGERKMLREVECDMCKAILREMHVEVRKHGMTEKGVGSESHVWETANAMCLALLQKYTLNMTVPSIEQKAEGEDDEAIMERMGASFDTKAYMRSMLVLKMGCQRWLEDYGGDTSGYIYKTVRESSNTAEGGAVDFCTLQAHQCGTGKKEKRQKEKEKEKKRKEKRAEMMRAQDAEEAKEREKDPFQNLPEDSKFGLQRMLEMAKDDPFHYMEEDAKKRVSQARADLRCDVCRAVLKEVHGVIGHKPKTMRTEVDILPLFEQACEGGKDLSVPNYFGVEPPPLPPVWTDKYRPHLTKKSGRYVLREFPRRAAKARRKWRKLSATGRQKPPPAGEAEEDAMLTMACTDVLEAERMTEALYKRLGACDEAPASDRAACDPVAAATLDVCKSADETACRYDKASRSAPSQQQEL